MSEAAGNGRLRGTAAAAVRKSGHLVRALTHSPRELATDIRTVVVRHAAAAKAARDVRATPLPGVLPLEVDLVPAEPHLNVLVPGMTLGAMSGGPNTALNLAARVAARGFPVRFVSTDVPAEADHERIWRHLEQLTGGRAWAGNVSVASAADRRVRLELGDRDVFLATAWWTAQLVKPLLPRSRVGTFVYLVQDFEPGFYPWSTAHALALETYGLPFRAIVNESLLLEHLTANRIGRFADPAFVERCSVFEPAVDARHFHPAPRGGDGPRRLLFYARPQAPRNLFELGVAALREAVARGAFPPGRWELRSMGERVRPVDLGGGASLDPLPWLAYDAYGELVRSSHAGLALMLSPHTGYPALELAACGLPVVTNTFGVKTPERLAALSPHLVAAEPSLESVVAALVEAARRAEAGEPRADGPQTTLPPAWDDVLERQAGALEAMIEDALREAR